jgi:hypothetical protein
MGVVIRIGARRALLREGEWRCADLRLEQRLNAQTEAWIAETGGPELGAEDPEAEVAREMARRNGGAVQMHAPAQGGRMQRLYFARRQFSFNFQNGT